MGIKLEWDIEAEQGKHHKQHKEDFKDRSARYLALLRLLFLIVVFVAIVGVVVYIVYQRWNMVNERLESILTQTVEAEVAALRIGDLDSFINIQRSATDDWLVTQQARFTEYQRLKATSNITLSGRILDLEVSEQRARVQVEEIVSGVPYVQTWFYWRYEDGWRHVPPDYTFWGEAAQIDTARFTLRYQTVDELTAQGVALQVQRWFEDACSYLDCSTVPKMTIDIVSNDLPPVLWANESAWQLLITSPYRNRARADLPFDSQYQLETATLLTNRFVNHTSNSTILPPHSSDALYLRNSLVAWMVGRFIQVNPESYLLESLVNHYGIVTIPNLIQTLPTNPTVNILATITAFPNLPEMSLDWRDFIQWRLTTEDELIRQGNEAAWQALYDFRDSSVSAIAYGRFTTNSGAQSYQVLEVFRSSAGDGTPQLQARVQVTTATGTIEEQLVLFNFINQTWLRAS